jgi:hypothetical protein
VTLTTHLHLVPQLGMSGAILPLHLYAFMVWTGKFYLSYFLIFPEFARLDKYNKLLFKGPCFKIRCGCLNFNSCDSVYRVTFEILTKNRKLKEIAEEKEKVVGQ